jgi:hypothetical protein
MFISFLYSRIIQKIKFDKQGTAYIEAINFTVNMFGSQHDPSNSTKLMITLSDGQRIYTEKV